MTPAEKIAAAYADYERLSTLAILRSKSPLVPGAGPLNAPVLLVGEAPGAEEVKQLKPFVGASGRLLNTMLAAAGVPRRFCYVTNVVLYRPPGNRTPERFEIAASRERLCAEIEAVQPALVITLGAVARRALKPQGDPVSLCHGQPEPLGFIWNQDYQPGDPIALEAEVSQVCTMLPTYHPSAALRDAAIHAKMRQDLKLLERFAVTADD